MDAGEVAPAPVRLVGRRSETRQLRSMVARAARGRGGAVVVRGETGIGKTALIDHVAAGSHLRTLRACPAEPERTLPYAALADLLLPMHDYIEQVPDTQRTALDVGLALRSGAPPEVGVLTSGTRGVLAAAAAAQPILVFVDDAQWLDPPSRQVLADVAAHLEPLAVLMIIAVRCHPHEDPGLGGIPTIALGGLSATESRALLRARASPSQVDGIVASSGGNPRLLLTCAGTGHRPSPSAKPPRSAADVEIVRGWATTWAGHPQRAVSELVRAAEAIEHVDAPRAAALYLEAALPAAIAGRVTDMLELTRRADALSARSGATAVAAATTSAAALALSGAGPDARLRLDEALTLAGRPPEYWGAHIAVLYAQVRMWLEEHDEAERVVSSVVERARSGGPPGCLPHALSVRAELAWWAGEWTAARRYAVEAVRRAERLRQVAGSGFALVTLARIEVSRGELIEGRRLAERALRETGPYGVDGCRPFIDAALGLGSLASGDALVAAEHLERARRTAERCGLSAPSVVAFGGDLVEAHIRAGHEARAREALLWLDGQAAASGLALPAATAARCRGLLAHDLDRAGGLFALAKTLSGHRDLPFERGRTLLCEGETLRRLRRPALARTALHEAIGIFTDIGSRPWAAAAERELASSGTRSAADPTPVLGTLTPRERQIASIVADGRSNAEAASALFISRRTVEAHLNRIYSKLGVRSRTELARRVATVSNSLGTGT